MKKLSGHQIRLWNLISFLDSFLDDQKELSILDLGGTEKSAEVLKIKYPKAKLFTANLKKKKVQRNNIICDAHNIAFNSSVFDLILCIELIEHVYQPQLVMREIRRVGRKNSLLFLSTPNMNAWHNRFLVPLGSMPVNYTVVPFRQYGSLLPRSSNFVTNQDHCRIFNFDAMNQFVKDEGFSLIASFGINYNESGNRFNNLRRYISHVIPKTLMENILIIATNCKSV